MGIARLLASTPCAPAQFVAAALVAAAGLAAAQGSDCAKAAADLRARGKPVCTTPSAMSPAEAVACAEFQRLVSIVDDCVIVAKRDDRRRLDRYPNEASHRKAEVDELAQIAVKLHAPNARLGELLGKRKALDDEAEFYKGKPLPRELQRQIEANDASLLALRDVFRGVEGEIAGVVARFDDERGHLRQLRAGVAPGSLGVFVPRSTTSAMQAQGNAPAKP